MGQLSSKIVLLPHLRHMAPPPLLNPSELKSHLSLLRAFRDLKSQVEDEGEFELNAHALSSPGRWDLFVQAAVKRCVIRGTTAPGSLTFRYDRFYDWASRLKVDGNGIIDRTEFPSLDVCLVWHAYMLNPR